MFDNACKNKSELLQFFLGFRCKAFEAPLRAGFPGDIIFFLYYAPSLAYLVIGEMEHAAGTSTPVCFSVTVVT
jgi:hypothetical protein